VAWDVGDFRREVEDSDSEVSEDECVGEEESAFGMVKFAQRQRIGLNLFHYVSMQETMRMLGQKISRAKPIRDS
jgi:hypothetical protein